jgi:hypothetical protein
VWPPLVVVGHVHPQHSLGVASTQDERPVQAFPPDGPHPALGEGVRPRSLERVRIVVMPSAAKTASKLLVNLESRSRIRKRSGGCSERFRACWVTHAAFGCRVTPAT